MTDYRLYGVTHNTETDTAELQIIVGKRSALQPIELTDKQLWDLQASIAGVIRRKFQDRVQPTGDPR